MLVTVNGAVPVTTVLVNVLTLISFVVVEPLPVTVSNVSDSTGIVIVLTLTAVMCP